MPRSSGIGLLIALAVFLLLAGPAHSHAWYAQKQDPVYLNGCCGGYDCHELDGGLVEAEAEGYRIRLTLQQAQQINEYTIEPIDALVTWARVQPSMDGNWHLCIFTVDRTEPRNGVLCLFAPPSM